MINPNLPDATESPHAAFLHAIQEWVWTRYPTRQLSATDIFYSLQWAESQLPASVFIRSFEDFLAAHPHHFDDGCRLSKLQFEARRIIAQQQKAQSEAPRNSAPIVVNDPFHTALKIITICGQRTENPILKDALRKLYADFRTAQQQTRQKYPDWDRHTEAFYRLKAEALLLWQESVQKLCDDCLALLSENERQPLTELTAAEKIHCMQLGPEAEKIYKNRVRNEKITEYFGVHELLGDI